MIPTRSRTVCAATLVAPGRVELREYPYPSVDDGGAVIRVELCALCGTDYSVFRGEYERPNAVSGPVVPGHEVVGVLEAATAGWLEPRRVELGDRVVVEPNIPCGACPSCVTGQYVSCSSRSPMAHGFVPAGRPPGLWGGYSEAMYLSERSIVHRVPPRLDPGRASLCNAVANGFEWASNLPGLRFGQSVLVLGAGQRGLAAIAAARASGAGRIIATGLSADAARLAAARELGADATIVADAPDAGPLSAAVRDRNDGRLVDVAIDCSAGATQPVIDAIASVVTSGTVVLAGMKHGRPADGFPVDEVVGRRVRILGALSAGYEANEQALRFLASDAGAALARYRTHELPLAETEQALRLLGGELASEHPVYVSIAPGS